MDRDEAMRIIENTPHTEDGTKMLMQVLLAAASDRMEEIQRAVEDDDWREAARLMQQLGKTMMEGGNGLEFIEDLTANGYLDE